MLHFIAWQLLEKRSRIIICLLFISCISWFVHSRDAINAFIKHIHNHYSHWWTTQTAVREKKKLQQIFYLALTKLNNDFLDLSVCSKSVICFTGQDINHAIGHTFRQMFVLEIYKKVNKPHKRMHDFQWPSLCPSRWGSTEQSTKLVSLNLNHTVSF